mgnify:CR=1 FL=1
MDEVPQSGIEDFILELRKLDNIMDDRKLKQSQSQILLLRVEPLLGPNSRFTHDLTTSKYN